MRGVAQHRDPAAGPARDRIAVVERPLVPDLAGREHAQNGLVPAAVALEHLGTIALGDPRLVPVVLVVVVTDGVDQLAAAQRVQHDRAVRPQPGGVLVPRRFTRHGVDRDHAAVADLAREPRGIPSEQRGPDRRVDPVRSDDDVGLHLAPVLEPRDCEITVGLDCDAARAQPDDGVG